MAIKQLWLKNYREYLANLKKKLDISDTQEELLYKLIEDSYNSVENDNIGLHKTFSKIEHSTSFNFEEKMFGSMMLLLCDLKTRELRQINLNRKFKSNFGDDEELGEGGNN